MCKPGSIRPTFPTLQAFGRIVSGSGMIFNCTNSSTTDNTPSHESTKPNQPCFFALDMLHDS